MTSSARKAGAPKRPSPLADKTDMKPYRIIGHQLCPYVQRAVIVMAEKGIRYDRTDIDLDRKPKWLKVLSPTGKVPVLIVNTNVAIFESNVISEYLDETSAGTLYPLDPVNRAIHRSLIEYGSNILNPIASIIYRGQTEQDLHRSMENIEDSLRYIETRLTDNEFFDGRQFQMVDVVYSTIFRYFSVLELLSGANPLNSMSKTAQWAANLQKRPSVRNAVPAAYDTLLCTFIAKRDSYAARQMMRIMPGILPDI